MKPLKEQVRDYIWNQAFKQMTERIDTPVIYQMNQLSWHIPFCILAEAMERGIDANAKRQYLTK